MKKNTANEPALIEHIDRVGEMFFSRWKEVKFSDFVLINPTVSLKGDKVYSFVEMKDLQDGNKICSPSEKRKISGGSRFQERDTLFARITPCLENGKICQVRGLENGIGFGSTEFLVFRGNKNKSDNEFVFYLSRWNEVRDFAENNFEGTSGRQRVPKNCFENLKLFLPPLAEQTAIAEVLSSLDDKIDLLHRQNKTLEQLAETLFRQWFIEEADTKTLGELAKVSTGKGLKRNEFVENGLYPILGANGEIGLTNKFLIEEKIILTGRVGTLGEVKISNGKVWISDNVLMIKPNDDKFFYPIYFSLLRINFENMNVGSTQPLITQTDLKKIKLNFPNVFRLEKFSEDCNLYFDKIKSNQKQIRTLTQLRDNLLPKLMSGEVRVSDVGAGLASAQTTS